MVKRIFLALFIILLILIVWQFDLVKYGLQQGKGQLHIVWNSRPVSEYMDDPTVADSVKAKLLFIGKVRRYAIDSLGLNDTENYTSMYDQGGQPVLWVVTGCKPFSFDAWEWSFPIVGTVPYKGFFESEEAVKEVNRLHHQGYETGIRNVGGWSTLGWFKDPILSEMLNRNWGDLANLIIHELSHSTIFVKDSVIFNENLASFIGDKGAAMFLKDMYGQNSKQYSDYQKENADELLYYEHILRGADQLDALYHSFPDSLDSLQKQTRKSALIVRIMHNVDTLNLSFPDLFLANLRETQPNNTYFMSFMRYREKQQDLDALFAHKFNDNLKEMIEALKTKYPFL